VGKMFRKGKPYQSIEEFTADYADAEGSGYVYYNHKAMHMGFASSMSLRTICGAIHKRFVFRAIRTENNSEERITYDKPTG